MTGCAWYGRPCYATKISFNCPKDSNFSNKNSFYTYLKEPKFKISIRKRTYFLYLSEKITNFIYLPENISYLCPKTSTFSTKKKQSSKQKNCGFCPKNSFFILSWKMESASFKMCFECLCYFMLAKPKKLIRVPTRNISQSLFVKWFYFSKFLFFSTFN